MSVSGVFFLTAEAGQIGEWLRCRLFLKSAEPGQDCLRFEGRVVRVEPCDNQYGIAAHFDALQSDLPFLTGHDDASAGVVTH